MNSELMKEFMYGIADGSIKLSDSPALRKLIHNYLHHFDSKIRNPVNSLRTKADSYNQQAYNIANRQWQSIIQTGNNYQQALKNAMAKNYSPKKVNQITQSTIQNNVSQAVGTADHTIDQYFASLSDNTRKSRKLSARMDTLEKRQNKADEKQNKTNSRFWCGIFGAFILGAIFSFVFL